MVEGKTKLEEKPTIGLFWNVRGLNNPTKVSKVKNLLKQQLPNIIGLSETKKSDFTVQSLESFTTYDNFAWNWLPAIGTAGGILVGVNTDLFEVISWDIKTYYVLVSVKNKLDHFCWNFVAVYGSSYKEHKQQFIDELHNLFSHTALPTIVGGDFNLVRFTSDKNIGNIHKGRAAKFNDWIN